MRAIPEATERPHGVLVEPVGGLIRMMLPDGSAVMLSQGQAIELSAELVTARNRSHRVCPGGAS